MGSSEIRLKRLLAAGQAQVVVPGLDAYMKNVVGRARGLAAERREREERVFHLNPKARPEPFTLPQPFAAADRAARGAAPPDDPAPAVCVTA